MKKLLSFATLLIGFTLAFAACTKPLVEVDKVSLEQSDQFIKAQYEKGITEWTAPGYDILRTFDKTALQDTDLVVRYGEDRELTTRAPACTIEQFWGSDAVGTLTGSVYLSVYHDSQLIYFVIKSPSELYSGVGRTIGTNYTSGSWKVRAQPLAGGYSNWNPGTVYIGVYWPSSGSWGVNSVYCCTTLVSNDHYYSSCNL